MLARTPGWRCDRDRPFAGHARCSRGPEQGIDQSRARAADQGHSRRSRSRHRTVRRGHGGPQLADLPPMCADRREASRISAPGCAPDWHHARLGGSEGSWRGTCSSALWRAGKGRAGKARAVGPVSGRIRPEQAGRACGESKASFAGFRRLRLQYLRNNPASLPWIFTRDGRYSCGRYRLFAGSSRTIPFSR